MSKITQNTQLEQLLELATKIATEAHKGQVDKGGNPYILHPTAVADSLDKTEHKIVAMLHDVIEDTHIAADDLLKFGFPETIVHSVQVLTKSKGIKYSDYLAEIKKDDIAKHVKIADIKHNMDISRIPNPTQKDFDRIEKYKKAIAFLSDSPDHEQCLDKTLPKNTQEEFER